MYEEEEDRQEYRQIKRKNSAELWEESRLDYMGHKKNIQMDGFDEEVAPDDENEIEIELNEKEAPFLKG